MLTRIGRWYSGNLFPYTLCVHGDLFPTPSRLALSTFFNPMTQPARTHPFLTGVDLPSLLSLFPGFDWTLEPAAICVFIDGRGVKIAWPLTFYMGILGTSVLAIPDVRQ